MVVWAKVCELTDDFLVCMWFVCGNFDSSPNIQQFKNFIFQN